MAQTMENKLRATLLAMVLFCLLLPMNIGGETEPSLNYYINTGSEDAVATSVPVIIEFFGAGMSFFFSNNVTPAVNIALLQLLIWELMLATALLFWNYAIL